jgi:hypothetical protein
MDMQRSRKTSTPFSPPTLAQRRLETPCLAISSITLLLVCAK